MIVLLFVFNKVLNVVFSNNNNDMLQKMNIFIYLFTVQTLEPDTSKDLPKDGNQQALAALASYAFFLRKNKIKHLITKTKRIKRVSN